ncbi:UDP-N-acetylglucosamine 2-epimerase [uncultured Desulfobacter sp.]|uniref:UDP-N-acetylglucosamine 2-epimerase n=1 Tax=uncultured Desulfobacter sp. TaxID=240139 RepID=UPI0029F503B9|nr:UDP-N-acetylglucosamine 2-epimerase [uncultured Desulfobacter sp.]
MNKRKICVVVASRANYGRVKYLMKAVKEHPQLELQLIVGASTLLYRFGEAVNIIREDGFEPDRKLYYIVEGETLSTQAKSTGLGIVELSTAFEDLNPDIVVTVADRFETMSTAIAATYMNITLAHLQGGEVSGNIDEKVRHAITKLSDIHFPASEKSKQRIIKMGEDASRVFNYGCPAMDILKNEELVISNEKMAVYGGTGKPIDWTKPYILVVQHPVTTSYGQGYEQVMETLSALNRFKAYQKVVLWPNIDAGTDDVSKGIRIFREMNRNEPFHYFRNFSPEDYGRVLNNAVCCVGNSSSFIREGCFLGVPAVIIGDRQESREQGQNVIVTGYSRKDISDSIETHLNNGRYPRNTLFGGGDAGKQIADKLATIECFKKKRITY